MKVVKVVVFGRQPPFSMPTINLSTYPHFFVSRGGSQYKFIGTMNQHERQFSVQLEQEINHSLKEKSGLVPFIQKNKPRFINCTSKRCCRCCCESSRAPISRLHKILNSNDYFDNELFQLLFNAFVYAEARFIKNYIPQNSHEERLTGHLISEYSSALCIIRNAFQEKAHQIYNENLSLDFYYADLSSNAREKSTGADFGIMFHINLPDYPNEVRAAVFQAKKFKSSATIDIRQCNKLKEFGEEGANYCFYDMSTKATSSPLVLRADRINLSSDSANKTKNYSRDEIFNSYSGGIPLSLFLVFDMLVNDDGTNYKSYENIWEAKGYFNSEQTKGQEGPDRVLTVSIGGLAGAGQDLSDLSHLYHYPSFE